MKVLGVIQCRSGSSRLPGKALLDLNGGSVLSWVIQRARLITGLNDLVVATTDQPADDPVVQAAFWDGCDVIRGDEDDVLSRYIEAVEAYQPDAVVRVTADNPLTDPTVADRCIETFVRAGADYCYAAGYPIGTAIDVFAVDALYQAAARGGRAEHREHINGFFLENYLEFGITSLVADSGQRRADVRVTLDTFEDLQTLRAVFARLRVPVMSGIDEIIHCYDTLQGTNPGVQPDAAFPVALRPRMMEADA